MNYNEQGAHYKPPLVTYLRTKKYKQNVNDISNLAASLEVLASISLIIWFIKSSLQDKSFNVAFAYAASVHILH